MPVSYPAYQCLKTVDRDVYCSKSKVSSHTFGATWVTNCMAHYGITSSQLSGRPYLSASKPSNATIYPA